MEMEHRTIHGEPFPQATFGNEPRHGGRNIIVAVVAGKETVPRMTPSAAAKELGVTPGRVSQMIAKGQLESFEDSGRRWVTCGSVETRKATAPKAGRPRRAATA